MKKSRFDNAECRKCKGLGHFQRVCNWNSAGPSQPNAQCQLCHQFGHTAAFCFTLSAIAQGNQLNPADRHSRPGFPHDVSMKIEICFVTKDNPDLGFTSLNEHKINLKPNAVSKHRNPYRLPPYKREILREQLDDLLRQGIITPVSESEELPITSPVVLVTKRSANTDKKESQNFRFCCDFRHLNAQTEDFKYVIPNLQELTESMWDLVPNFITSIDLSSGFFQMGISPDSTRYTAFNTCFGTYKFQRLPMGLKTAPNTFQLLMDKVLHGLKFYACVRMTSCSAQTFEKHLNDLNEIFERLRSAGLKLGAKKCYFVKEKNQRFEWKAEQRMALNDMKTRLVNSEILNFPSFDLPFRLAVDTSSRGIGYMLYQKDSQISKPKIIRFGSKSLKPWQLSYGPTKLELLGMVTSVLDCAVYLRGIKFIVECDHQALHPLFQKQFKGAIYERLLAVLQQFSFVIEYKPAEQMQVADALSRCENPHSLQAESPTEEDPYFPYITDKVGEIELPGGQNFAELFRPQKSTSNDMSDNDIVHTGKEIPIVQVIFYDKNQDPYDADTDEPTATENKKNVIRKRNIKNKTTSDSAKSANSAESTNEEKTDDQNHIDLCNGVKDMAKVKNEQRNDFEYKHIITYLEDNQLPLSQKHARRILLEAPDHILIHGVLYRNRKAKSERNKSKSAYQLAVPHKMIDMILFMIHDSPLGGHSGIQNTLDRLRDNFYFS
ncbi:unnamed protein product [Mytilus coruscus]|uniref:Reverse transcriptase domain-containing protein n=1 Tax=Mytilus coruscus TaxID=42192 RepID=A0A6J8DHK2_MYTCO|nr:unnamed protein product [Mytilus coruscus]